MYPFYLYLCLTNLTVSIIFSVVESGSLITLELRKKPSNLYCFCNPINVLADIISKLKNKDGRITIPGFYDDVLKLKKKERENFKALPFSARKFAASLGVQQLKGETIG